MPHAGALLVVDDETMRAGLERIVGPEVGAGDCVTRPFDPRELVARIKSVMRRLQSLPAEGAAANTDP